MTDQVTSTSDVDKTESCTSEKIAIKESVPRVEPLSNQASKNNKTRGIMTVIGGVLIHLMIGNLYLWGNIEPYVISYFHWKGD